MYKLALMLAGSASMVCEKQSPVSNEILSTSGMVESIMQARSKASFDGRSLALILLALNPAAGFSPSGAGSFLSLGKLMHTGFCPLVQFRGKRCRVIVLTEGGFLSELAPRFFDWFKNSEGVAKLHADHVQSETVQHMMKGTPLVGAPDKLKLDFARGAAGKAVADFMRTEQRFIGDWKIERIVEAAGLGFDADAMRARLLKEVSTHPVVMFSFVDCPWCLLAKEKLGAMEASSSEPALSTGNVRIVELEELGREGKALRAAIALATGRTSMPAIFIRGRSIGGFTDGDPCGDPSLCYDGSPGLEALAASGQLQDMLLSES